MLLYLENAETAGIQRLDWLTASNTIAASAAMCGSKSKALPFSTAVKTIRFMNTKHSPTPWVAYPDNKSRSSLRTIPIYGADKVLVAEIRVYSYASAKTKRDWSEHVANSEFMSKAVNCHDDMLAALEKFDTWTRAKDVSNLSEVIKAAREAIAKAKGQS